MKVIIENRSSRTDSKYRKGRIKNGMKPINYKFQESKPVKSNAYNIGWLYVIVSLFLILIGINIAISGQSWVGITILLIGVVTFYPGLTVCIGDVTTISHKK